MKNIKCFENFDNNIQEDVYEKQFIEKYPEIRKMKLNKNDDEYHFYTENIDIFIEKNKSDDWDLFFEMKNESNSYSEEKLYQKTSLDWSELNFHLKKLCEYIRNINYIS